MSVGTVVAGGSHRAREAVKPMLTNYLSGVLILLTIVTLIMILITCSAALWRMGHPIQPIIKVCYHAGSCAPALKTAP